MISLLILCSFPETFRLIRVRRAVGANTAAQLKFPCPVMTDEWHNFEREFWMQIILLFIAAGKLLFTAPHMSHRRRPAALEMGLGRKYDGCVLLCGVIPVWSYSEVAVVEFGAAAMRIRRKPKGTATGSLI